MMDAQIGREVTSAQLGGATADGVPRGAACTSSAGGAAADGAPRGAACTSSAGGAAACDLERVRQAIAAEDADGACALLAQAGLAPSLSAAQATDLLERACAFGLAPVVDELYARIGAVEAAAGGDPCHPFAYEGFALALALRYARGDVARDLLARGVDLLGTPHRPASTRGMLPANDAFTRFGLTRQSPTLFLNPMDPTTSSEVFRGPHAHEQLAGEKYAPARSLAAACALVGELAAAGAFDPTVFDDLFRASLVCAWHALRHDRKDEAAARTCLDLCSHMLALYRTRAAGSHAAGSHAAGSHAAGSHAAGSHAAGSHAAGAASGAETPPELRFGDDRLPLLLQKMIVPRGDPRIARYVCTEEPAVFLRALGELDWLQDETALVRGIVPLLGQPSVQDRVALASPSDVTCLLALLARAGDLAGVRMVAAFPQVDDATIRQALDAASEAGHAELAAWLLSRLTLPAAIEDTPDAAADPLADLLL